MDIEYRAVYKKRNNTKGPQYHDGALTAELKELHTSVAGIVKHWPSVVSATIYSYPSRKPIVTYMKEGAAIRYTTA